MKKVRNTIFKYLFELLIVAFGVFLGIYVSEWKADQRTKDNASKSVSYIIDELKSNREQLSYSIEYHELIKTSVRSLTQTLDREQIMKPYFGNRTFHVSKIDNWKGVGLPNYETISYEGAKINGVFQDIDFEIVQLIAKAYRQISFNQEMGQSVMDKMLSSNSSTKVADMIGILEMLTSDVLVNENYLFNELKTIIEKLESQKIP